MKNHPGILDLIQNAFKIFSRSSGNFIAFTLLFFGLGQMFELLDDHIYPVFSFVNDFLIGPALAVGWYYAAKEIKEYNSVTFSAFLEGFKKIGGLIVIYLLEMFLLVVIFALIFLLVIGVSIPFSEMITNPENVLEIFVQQLLENSLFIGGLILLIMPIIYLLGMVFTLASLDYALQSHSIGRSFSKGWQLVQENPGQLLLMLVAFFILGLLGLLAFVIGLLVAIPIMHITLYLFYNSRTQVEPESTDLYEELMID